MLNNNIYICNELNLTENQVANTLKLSTEGATIPFIARYRKEMTGSLDEVQIEDVIQLNNKLVELEKRKTKVLEVIESQDKLTPDLKKRIQETFDLTELEDIYLPFKPKKRTRAEIAREKGLEGLAKILMSQNTNDVEHAANRFVVKDVENVDDALKGARDIIAEWINENEKSRNIVRRSFEKAAIFSCKVVKGKEVEGDHYKDYFKVEESLRRLSSHRFLAMKRGEKEGFLKTSIAPDAASPIHHLERFFLRGNTESTEEVAIAIADAYKRLLKPSIETEFVNKTKEKADEEAIRIFAKNLGQLLLAPPLGQKRTLAIDPGFRTGCKLVALDEQGKLLHNEAIFPHPPQNDFKKAARKVSQLIETFKLDAIAIGNGTASRETEAFIQRLHFDRKLQVYVVSENGASIYSASPIAREEFPQYDVTVRGAISIGRRLMDPLAELVKIDPKSIGVGQYQHDVDQNKLKSSLDNTVISCVNRVGIELNTASKYLLSYVSGIGPKLAENIIVYRDENGAFKNRNQLKKVSGLGPKAFEQAAGFLRIAEADNILDNSAVHPESYGVVEAIANDQKKSVQEMVDNKELLKSIDLKKYVSPNIGLPTLKDIVSELEKPGRDPRRVATVFEFDQRIRTIKDLEVGMILPGIVTNVTKFGAFVDVGIKENGLVHISEIADRFVSDPTEVVNLHEHVKVRIKELDVARKRVSLSMKGL